MTGLDLVCDVLRELNVISAAETPSAEDAVLVLGKMVRVIEGMNLEPGAAYCHTLTSRVLTPALNPHTIGASGATWTADRPVAIDAANLVIDDARYPLAVHHDSWRAGLPDPTLAGDPTDLDYEPTYPNGSVYLYPVPSSANSLELLCRQRLSTVTLTAVVTLPEGYHDAIVLTAAETCIGPFSVTDPTVVGSVRDGARKARARVKANNTRIPRLTTQDSGMPSSEGGGRWDYRTGMSRV